MNRARFAAHLAVEANTAFERDIADGLQVEEGRTAFIEERVRDGMAEAERQQAEDRERFGYPEDTPCVQSCDFYGTGEGQYHGVLQ